MAPLEPNMTRQTDADDGFDFEQYRETLVEYFLESFEGFYERPSYDAHDALTEAVFEATDEYLAYRTDAQDCMKILDQSRNEPQEWQHFAEGKNDWQEVIQAMAFTVTRQDLFDALEDEGYLNDSWNPTDKLTKEDGE